jgi:hypothetical protein
MPFRSVLWVTRRRANNFWSQVRDVDSAAHHMRMSRLVQRTLKFRASENRSRDSCYPASPSAMSGCSLAQSFDFPRFSHKTESSFTPSVILGTRRPNTTTHIRPAAYIAANGTSTPGHFASGRRVALRACTYKRLWRPRPALHALFDKTTPARAHAHSYAGGAPVQSHAPATLLSGISAWARQDAPAERRAPSGSRSRDRARRARNQPRVRWAISRRKRPTTRRAPVASCNCTRAQRCDREPLARHRPSRQDKPKARFLSVSPRQGS